VSGEKSREWRPSGFGTGVMARTGGGGGGGTRVGQEVGNGKYPQSQNPKDGIKKLWSEAIHVLLKPF